MKSILITLTGILLLGMLHHAPAQTINREIGLRMHSLNSFGIIWKKQKAENRFCRFTAAGSNFNFETGEVTNFSLSSAFAAGVEKRARLTDKVFFIFGPQGLSQLSGAYALAPNSQEAYTVIFSAGIGFLAGFHLDFGQHFYMDLDVTPSVMPFVKFDQFSNLRLGVNGGISNGGAGISLVYKLGPTPKKMKKGNAAE